jgi:uncharacterized lipoprotein YmbA
MYLRDDLMKKFLLIATMLLLSGCDGNENSQVQNPSQGSATQSVQGQPAAQQPQVVYVQSEQQPQSPPVVYQQAPQQPVVVQNHDSTGSLLTGMMVGHMMANSVGSGRSDTTIINKTYTKKVYVQPKQSRSYYGSSSSSRRSYGTRSYSGRRR